LVGWLLVPFCCYFSWSRWIALETEAAGDGATSSSHGNNPLHNRRIDLELLQSASEEEEESSSEEEDGDNTNGTSRSSSSDDDDDKHNRTKDPNETLGRSSLTPQVTTTATATSITTTTTTHSPNGTTINDSTSVMTKLKTPTPMIQIQFVMGTNLEEQHPTAMALLTDGGNDDDSDMDDKEENENGQKPCRGEEDENDGDDYSSCSETNVKPAYSDMVNRLLQTSQGTAGNINSTKQPPPPPPKKANPLIVEMD
jgi:hypothetical protein